MPIDHLPKRLRAPAERMRCAMMTDGTGLVLLGIGSLLRGIAFWDSEPTDHPAENFLGMDLWSLIWLTLAGLCFITATRPGTRTHRWAYAAALGLHAGWGASLLGSGLWLTASGYWLFGAAVGWSLWRGSKLELKIREVRE